MFAVPSAYNLFGKTTLRDDDSKHTWVASAQRSFAIPVPTFLLCRQQLGGTPYNFEVLKSPGYRTLPTDFRGEFSWLLEG